MKKLMLFIGLISFAALTFAQSSYDILVKANVNYGYYTGTASDTINGATTADAVFFVEYAAKGKYQLSFMIDGDTLAGCAGNTTIQAQGSYDGVTYSNVGSAITWTSSTAVYAANTSHNTYTTLASGTLTNAQHTRTTAAFNVLQDTTGMATYFADTIAYPAQTQTVAAQTTTDARTVTITTLGIDYRYIKILLTGTTNTRVELDAVAIKVTPITVPQ